MGRRLPCSHTDANSDMGKLVGLAGIPSSLLENTVVLAEEPGELTGRLIFLPTCYVTLGSSCNLSEPSFLICLMLRTHCSLKTSQGGQRKFSFYRWKKWDSERSLLLRVTQLLNDKASVFT